jgi:hypothetical protein
VEQWLPGFGNDNDFSNVRQPFAPVKNDLEQNLCGFVLLSRKIYASGDDFSLKLKGSSKNALPSKCRNRDSLKYQGLIFYEIDKSGFFEVP